MSRFVFFIFVNFILISQIKFGFGQYNDTSTVCDCNCDVEIDVVKQFIRELEEVRKSTGKISNIEKQLLGNRASNPSSCREAKPSTCMEAAAYSLKSGVYKIKLEKMNITELDVFCEEKVDSGGWLVIQRRRRFSQNFNRKWSDYKKGFGDLTGDYWFGLEKLHALTSSCEQELYIEVERINGAVEFAKYSEFVIADEAEDYALKDLGYYSGNSRDSLRSNLGYRFSTYDHDSRKSEELYDAEEFSEGGWWLNGFDLINLNGHDGDNVEFISPKKMISDISVTLAQMMIRPTENCFRRLALSNLN